MGKQRLDWQQTAWFRQRATEIATQPTVVLKAGSAGFREPWHALVLGLGRTTWTMTSPLCLQGLYTPLTSSSISPAISHMQRLCGASPIQEQFHPQCYLDAPQHTYGELAFAFIKKDERPSKTGPRAFKAIYAGKCRKVKGNILVHPIAYDIKTGSWTILPTQSVCQYRIIAGCMPLLTTEDATIKDYSGQTEDLSIHTYEDVLKKFPVLDTIDEDSGTEADPDPKPVKDGDWESEKIIEHKEIAEDDYDYCVRWKGWSPGWDTWHSQ